MVDVILDQSSEDFQELAKQMYDECLTEQDLTPDDLNRIYGILNQIPVDYLDQVAEAEAIGRYGSTGIYIYPKQPKPGSDPNGNDNGGEGGGANYNFNSERVRIHLKPLPIQIQRPRSNTRTLQNQFKHVIDGVRAIPSHIRWPGSGKSVRTGPAGRRLMPIHR